MRRRAVAMGAAAMTVLAVFLSADPAAGQGLNVPDSPKEFREQAYMSMQTGNYQEAIVYLSRLIEWFKDSRDESTQAQVEDYYFNMGLCHLFLGQFAKCREVYEEYLKKYRSEGRRCHEVAAYIGDAWRYENKLDDAIKSYQETYKRYRSVFYPYLEADVLICLSKCWISKEKWDEAVPLLRRVVDMAPDPSQANWAAAMLTISYLKKMDVENVYRMMPILLAPNSFASRSAALNITALETGDELFADEKYRDGLWIYRLVYAHDTLMANCLRHLDRVARRLEWMRRTPGSARPILRAQEGLAEAEAEIKALEQIPNYDPELNYRVARSYMEIKRYRESCEAFYNLYLDGPKDRQEECLYLSYLSATKFTPYETCFARGHEYMRVYPGGRYYDKITLSMGMLYAFQKNWPKVIEVLEEAIKVSPKHEDIVECLFLLGYAHFMEEHFVNSFDHLDRLLTDYPGNDRESEGGYWAGMSLMFDTKYADARPYFDRVVDRYPDSPYAEDAMFRSATCDYGLSEFYEAETKLLKFVTQYPQSRLRGEAYLMLGDVSGVFGELAEGIRRYQRALAVSEEDEKLLHVEFYNHCAFKAGEMLYELKRHDDLIAHFERYIERNREGSNAPMAIYWIGRALWERGEPERALARFRRAIEEYGKDRKSLGIDLIFEEWVGRTRGAAPEIKQAAWNGMRELLGTAIQTKEYPLMLRVARILRYDQAASEEEKKSYRNILLNPNVLPHASIGVLETVMTEAALDGNRDLMVAAARRIIDDFTETDAGLSARMTLAKDALSRKDFDEAIRQLTVVRTVYAASPEAADALMALGNVYLEKKDLEAADEAFKDILGVKAWKAKWPEANYGRGQAAMAARKYDAAAAYFERIYVLYGAHKQWVAKAYLARAQCLQRLYEYQKAVETLRELVDNPELQSLPEAAEAKDLIEKLRRRT